MTGVSMTAEAAKNHYLGTAWPALSGRLRKVLPAALHPLVDLTPQISRYTLASVAALALDLTVYAVLTSFGWRPSVAGVLGYMHGLLLHFSLSTRLVFDTKATQKSEMRLFLEFATCGLVGIGITWLVIAVMTEVLHTGAMAAKLAAVVLSFAAVFVLRRSVVFADRG